MKKKESVERKPKLVVYYPINRTGKTFITRKEIEEKGVTATIDFDAMKRYNLEWHYILIHNKKPTKKQLDEFIKTFKK